MSPQNQILDLCNGQRFGEAKNQALQWAQDEPNNAAAWSALTFALEGLGEHQYAFETINRAITLSSRDPAHLMHRGQLSFGQSQLADAADDLSAAAALAHETGHGYKNSAVLGHAFVLAKLGQVEQAKERASLCPDDTRMWLGEPIQAASFKESLNSVH